MQPTATARCSTGSNSSGNNGDPNSDPADVFCKLGSLIVEGRLPLEKGGFCEGPHVPQQQAKVRHECREDSYMCKKDENFRRHMLLLWQNNVPVSIEVLLSPDCSSRFGGGGGKGQQQQQQNSLEFSTVPEPGSVLLEQWTVSVTNDSSGGGSKHVPMSSDSLINARGLFQAVRSYLHFSQLSAWLASTKGERPKNVLFRVTVPGEEFASKFSKAAEEHSFPPAGVNRSSVVRVSVRSLPRSDAIPEAVCGCKSSGSSSSAGSGEDLSEEGKLAMAGAIAWKDFSNSDQDLRKALVRSKMTAECMQQQSSSMANVYSDSPMLPRSDSMDSSLGDSLLDPPQCLQRMPPKRYQSPSRCGSPSLEAPEHLLFGGGSGSRRTSATNDLYRIVGGSSSSSSERCARQDLIRRRDLNLYSGLHPRLLLLQHNAATATSQVPSPSSDTATPPRLSLPPKSNTSVTLPTHRRRQAEELLESDMALPPTTTGQKEEEEESKEWTHEYFVKEEGGVYRRRRKFLLEESGIERDLEDDDDIGDKLSNWQKSACSSRRTSSSKDEDEVFMTKEQKCNSSSKKRPSLHDIFDDGSIRPSTAPLTPIVTQVYRADTDTVVVDKGDLLLTSIIRTSERNRRLLDAEEEEKRKNKFLLTTPEYNDAGGRVRSVSEHHFGHEDAEEEEERNYLLDPLDLSFEDSSVWSDYEVSSPFHSPTEETAGCNSDEESEHKSSNGCVPSSVDKDTFRKSFNSAASMVFHRRTGLPLTSSPAPLRKGKEKFDFDSSINSPNDIKRALFRAESQKMKQRKGRSNNSKLSLSAPASVTSSNLLGSFEESVLNGRLEPVSTVEGFTAEIGASGSFHPRHRTVPVTVFFYTLGDNSTISSPYLGHINLGKKGYRVPEKGTIQVTLFNPLGTVVKMFVVVYNLSDMPPNSQTFLRQRTLYMPSERLKEEEHGKDGQKWLRYLIHLRFASSKSGKLYLHTDIRMIIFRKSDLDTAADHSPGKGFELRSFTRGPNNPKFSPRK